MNVDEMSLEQVVVKLFKYILAVVYKNVEEQLKILNKSHRFRLTVDTIDWLKNNKKHSLT